MEKWTQNPDKIDNKNLTHRAVYSIVVAIFQYLLPLLIVLVIYSLIYKFLQESQYPRHLRQNKTNTLLSTISLTHCIMWLPFSLFNIMADLWPNEVSTYFYTSFCWNFFKKNFFYSFFKMIQNWWSPFTVEFIWLVWPQLAQIQFCTHFSMKILEENSNLWWIVWCPPCFIGKLP